MLLKKLSIIGFSDHIVKWFQSYLSNCKFTINLENSFSEVSNMSCGVPQGSTLGPFLLLIYVNDMPISVNICNWLVDNKQSFHFGADKTKSILFASKRKIKKLQKLGIICDNIWIKQHSRVTYLDCILEETMFGKSIPH